MNFFKRFRREKNVCDRLRDKVLDNILLTELVSIDNILEILSKKYNIYDMGWAGGEVLYNLYPNYYNGGSMVQIWWNPDKSLFEQASHNLERILNLLNE